MIDGAFYVDGNVAVQYYQPVPKYVQIGQKEYVCVVEHSVSMLLLPEEDVPSVLGYLGGCCGQKRVVFSLASEEVYNIWKTGRR